jgi:hypothetical protein
MSAEILREAAALMRERAEAATEGPWRVGAEGSEGSRVNPRTGDKREDSRWIASVNGRVQPEDGHNAAHIASWHPAVALAVADWLDATAADWDRSKAPLPVSDVRLDARAALAAARAYLGSDA